jgi:hypothetical protein
MATDYQAKIDNYNKSIAAAIANGGKTSSGVTVAQLQSGLASAQKSLNSSTVSAPTATVATSPSANYAPGSAAGPPTMAQYTTAVNQNQPVYVPPSGKTSNPTVPSNTNTPNYTYDQNSAAGPLTRDQYNTATDTGVAYVPPSTPTVQPNQEQPQYSATDSFTEKMKIIQQLFYPKKEQAPAYVSPYGDSINKLIELISGRVSNPSAYDPTTDAGLKVAQEDAVKASRTALGRRGMIGSGSGLYGQQGEIQAAQRLIPQYQQMYRQNEQQNTSNLFNQLSAIQGIENSKYNQYRDQVGDVNTKNQMNMTDLLSLANLTGTVSNQDLTQQQYTDSRTDTNYSKGLQQSKLIQDAYGIYVDPALLNPLTAQESSNVTALMNSLPLQNKSDYQEAMNAVGQNNPMYSVLQRARAQKIASDPKLLSQYGNQIGSQTLSGQQAQAQTAGINLGNISQALQNSILSAKAQNAGVVASKELEILEVQLTNGKLDNEGKRIANKYLDQNAQAEIAAKWANVNQSNASAQASLINATKKETENKPTTTVQDYYKSAKELKDSGDMDDADIVNSVLSFPISDQDKANILNRLGIKK